MDCGGRWIRLISCDQPSRGRQQNLGAAVARGELLCFHHADSELRPEHVAALARVAKNDAIIGGAFHRRFYPPRMLWREPLVRCINSLGGPLFGDQSLFVRTAVFREMGGFANFPLMEDVEFSQRLRRIGRVELLDPPLWSPPRRPGTWRTAVQNATLTCLYYLGIEPGGQGNRNSRKKAQKTQKKVVSVRERPPRGACLACEAVVRKGHSLAGLSSVCAFSCEKWASFLLPARIEVAI